jgi:hypothetical protein
MLLVLQRDWFFLVSYSIILQEGKLALFGLL